MNLRSRKSCEYARISRTYLPGWQRLIAIPAAVVASLPPTDALRVLQERLVSVVDHIEERAIIGTPQDCRRRLAEVIDEYGFDHIPFYFHVGGRDITRTRRGLELFAKEVMLEFR